MTGVGLVATMEESWFDSQQKHSSPKIHTDFGALACYRKLSGVICPPPPKKK